MTRGRALRNARSSPVSGRVAVRVRQSRDRAIAPTLRSRYPTLASLQLEFGFSDRTKFSPVPQVTVFHPPARAYFCFVCPYSDCDGEFDLASPVAQMMGTGESRAGGQMLCAGTRLGDTRCTLCLEYSLVAQWN